MENGVVDGGYWEGVGGAAGHPNTGGVEVGAGGAVDEDDEQSHSVDASRSARMQRAVVALCAEIVLFLRRNRRQAPSGRIRLVSNNVPLNDDRNIRLTGFFLKNG